MTPTNINVIEDQFIEFMGQVAEMCAFNRSIGQIYGILYISPNPLCLEDIAKACQMSKGNASIHLRTLENWGAARQTSKPGSRKDYYSANTDLRGLAIKRLQEGTARRLEHAKQKIAAIKEDPAFSEYLRKPESSHRKTRLDEIESLIQQVQSALTMLPKLLELKRFFPL
jgi:DNA-binding transcriptional regulator GbsR (MarR family)